MQSPTCMAFLDSKVSLKYDVIDLDPYGTAGPFLDAAVQAIADGGLLCVTCTDAGVFASIGYPEKTYALYGGLPLKGPHCHEAGLRLIIHAISTSAARYGRSIEPLLSLSIDFYARVFVRIRSSPTEVKMLAGKTMIVYNCDQGCGAWTTQPLGRHRLMHGKKGGEYFKFGLAQAPQCSENCSHCGRKTHVSYLPALTSKAKTANSLLDQCTEGRYTLPLSFETFCVVYDQQARPCTAPRNEWKGCCQQL